MADDYVSECVWLTSRGQCSGARWTAGVMCVHAQAQQTEQFSRQATSSANASHLCSQTSDAALAAQLSQLTQL